nr:hypothetical protein [Tanacetum cinerariifolium]
AGQLQGEAAVGRGVGVHQQAHAIERGRARARDRDGYRGRRSRGAAAARNHHRVAAIEGAALQQQGIGGAGRTHGRAIAEKL